MVQLSCEKVDRGSNGLTFAAPPEAAVASRRWHTRPWGCVRSVLAFCRSVVASPEVDQERYSMTGWMVVPGGLYKGSCLAPAYLRQHQSEEALVDWTCIPAACQMAV